MTLVRRLLVRTDAGRHIHGVDFARHKGKEQEKR